MIIFQEKNGSLYFYEQTRKYTGRFVKIFNRSEDETNYFRRMFTKKYGSSEKGNSFVQKCARKGLFDGVMTPEEVERAKRNGILPKEYDVHHLVPLALGGSNAEENLCVMHKDLHLALHKEHLNMIRNEWDEEAYPNAYLHVPDQQKFFTKKDLSLFFSDQECERIQKEIKIRVQKAMYHAKRRAESRQKQQPVRKRPLKPEDRPENWTQEIIRQKENEWKHYQKKQQKIIAKEQQKKEPAVSKSYTNSDKFHQSLLKRQRRTEY